MPLDRDLVTCRLPTCIFRQGDLVWYWDSQLEIKAGTVDEIRLLPDLGGLEYTLKEGGVVNGAHVYAFRSDAMTSPERIRLIQNRLQDLNRAMKEIQINEALMHS